MAITFVSSSKSENVLVGQGVDIGASTAFVQFDISPTWTGSLRISRKVSGAGQFMTCSYTKALNGQVDNAAITSSGLFIVDAGQSDIQVAHSMTSSGSVSISTGLVKN
jgi:hypothetical protein